MTSKLAQNIIDKMNQMIQDAQKMGVMIPPELQNADPQVIIDYLSQVHGTADKTDKTIKNVADAANREKLIRQQLEDRNQQVESTPISTSAPVATPMTASFNLKNYIKTSQRMNEFNMYNPGDMEGMSELNPGQKFQDSAALKTWLDGLVRTEAQDLLLPNIPDQLQDSFSSLMQQFYEEGDIFLSDEQKLRIAMQVFEMLPDSSKEEPEDIGLIPAEHKEFHKEHLMAFVNDVNEDIKKLASKETPKKVEKFNLSKFAQHQSIHNTIMYGPSSVRIDPFLRQPVTDWHILERNKGFGLVVDDVWNIDWETLWRQNVMDKYSRPYRDTKTGEWIGGYIQKRFEVDKNIPPENNYQLLPGQKRRPYIPEQRSTETRLEAMREKEGKKRGYGPVTEGKPFNWHTANNSKKIEKIAEQQTTASTKKKS